MEKDDSYIKLKFKDIPGNDASFPEEDFIDFRSEKNEKLHTYKYPVKDPVGVVIIFHGLHAYCNNYAFMAKCYAEVGCEVVSFDFLGHGKSEGTRAYLPSFDRLFDDCLRFANEVISLYPSLPVYLAGGSLGGALCILIQNHLREQNKIKGMMLFSPAIKANIKCAVLAEGLARLFSYLCPMMKLAKGDPEKFCPNDNVMRLIEENPYIYSGRIRAGTLGTVVKTMKRASGILHLISAPFIVIQGGNDQIVDPDGSQIMCQMASTESKECWMYPGLSHALLFEDSIYEILERVQNWLTKQILIDRS